MALVLSTQRQGIRSHVLPPSKLSIIEKLSGCQNSQHISAKPMLALLSDCPVLPQQKGLCAPAITKILKTLFSASIEIQHSYTSSPVTDQCLNFSSLQPEGFHPETEFNSFGCERRKNTHTRPLDATFRGKLSRQVFKTFTSLQPQHHTCLSLCCSVQIGCTTKALVVRELLVRENSDLQTKLSTIHFLSAHTNFTIEIRVGTQVSTEQCQLPTPSKNSFSLSNH